MMDMRKFGGAAVSKNAWTETENLILRRRYEDPKTSMEELEGLLPRRKRASIFHQASKLGLHRRRTRKCSDVPCIRRLWELREREGITRAQLAKKMGYHEVMLGRWERGESKPNLQKLLDWCQALGSTLTVTYRGTPLEPSRDEDDEESPALPSPMLQAIV